MRIYICIFFAVFLCSCVEEIQFESKDEVGTLVVDGLLSTNTDSNLVFLLRTSDLIKQVFPAEEGAQVVLFDGEGNSEQYEDLGQGKYHLTGKNIEVKVGGTYFIEISTRDGQHYRSEDETIISVPEIDSLVFDFSIEDIINRETLVQEKSFFNMYVDGRIPGDNGQTFLKWDVEHVYQVAEIECSPLVAPKPCYVTRKVNNNQIFTLDGEEYIGGATYHIPVIHQELDYAFGLVASFYVSQKSLTRDAYQYWEKIKQILVNGGTIFDAPPAPVVGNVVCISEPGQEVLGYFSAVDEKKKVTLITRGDLVDPFYELPLCGSLGNLPADIDFRVCCNCLTLDNSTRTRPSYWP